MCIFVKVCNFVCKLAKWRYGQSGFFRKVSLQLTVIKLTTFRCAKQFIRRHNIVSEKNKIVLYKFENSKSKIRQFTNELGCKS
jgi:hypothetical protein